MSDDTYTIEYVMELADGSRPGYKVEIDRETLVSRVTVPDPLPDWVKLQEGRCGQCSLPPGSAYCPIALRLMEPIRLFGKLDSFAKCTVTVVTPERNYVKKTDVQDALRSLFGLLMATSGCPAMQPFKYMAHYHLPFATLEETVSRIISSYLLRQFFRHEGFDLPVDLKDIERLYLSMQSLNEGMVKRLRSVPAGDGLLNAIVILNTYSSLIPSIINDELAKLKTLFS